MSPADITVLEPQWQRQRGGWGDEKSKVFISELSSVNEPRSHGGSVQNAAALHFALMFEVKRQDERTKHIFH